MTRRRPAARSAPSSLGRQLAAATVGYLCGTLPTADVAARVATGGATDIRSAGTGNPGAANAMKVLGRRWGLAVMAIDIGKGAAASRWGGRLAGDRGAHIAGTAAVIGHCHPVWTGFRGGKGVATSVGQVLATFPVYAPIDLAVAAATHALPGWRNRAHSATAVACGAWIAGAAWWVRRDLPNAWGPRPTAALPLAAAASSAVMLARFAAEERRPLPTQPLSASTS